MNLPIWAVRIVAARREALLTQEKLARALDIGQQTVSRWERGAVKPSELNRVRLARFFGVSVYDLFPYEDGDQGEAA